MGAILPINTTPRLFTFIHFDTPIETSEKKLNAFFFRFFSPFFHEPSLKSEHTILRLRTKTLQEHPSFQESTQPPLTIPPHIMQEIFAPHDALFSIREKEEILLSLEAFQAQVVIKGWTSYLEHLCEEALLRKASDFKYLRRKVQIEYQQEKARIEKEELQMQELRHTLLCIGSRS